MAQEGAPSERACDRCRERRVKCDKRQPTCLRCEKLGKPCPGYDKKRKFVDEGASLRKKFASSHPEDVQHSPEKGISSPAVAGASAKRFSPKPQYSKGITFANNPSEHESTPTLPAQDTKSLIDNDASKQEPIQPFGTDGILLPDATYPSPTIDTDTFFDDLFNDPSFDPSWFDMEPTIYYESGNNPCGFIPNIPNIVDEVDRNDLMQSVEAESTSPMSGLGFSSDNTLWAPESQLNTSAIITDEREHEMAYLIRHFTEAIGPWMDLFDQDKHFGNLVPLKALRDALLRNAIAAVAAKQLGRVRGTKPYMGVQNQKPATMEVIEEPEVDWFYKAANYYDKAIAFSRIYLQAISGSMSNPPTPGTQATVSMANSDDLLVAVSIFSLYESLDNLEIGWLQHLAGLRTLLNALNPDEQTQMQLIPAITVGRRASFWNYARADYQAAYINHQKTFLDTEDLSLWRSCGLQIQDDGSLYKETETVRDDPLHCRQVAELVAHTLLYLLLRVMNYLTSESDSSGPLDRQSHWLRLTAQLESWYRNLPQTFQPCAQIRYPLRTPQTPGSKDAHLTEVFFSMNVCAASLQLYHFARILLLLHKPEISEPSSTISRRSSGSSRLKHYREVSAEAIKHAHQIVGIALGRPHPAVRVEMLLPLFVAGTCLEVDEEREVVLELLKAIEMDTGCSTEARCKELRDEWGWSSDKLKMEDIVSS